jgi:hypothetical protein
MRFTAQFNLASARRDLSVVEEATKAMHRHL